MDNIIMIEESYKNLNNKTILHPKNDVELIQIKQFIA
jgi:hypothetical protein